MVIHSAAAARPKKEGPPPPLLLSSFREQKKTHKLDLFFLLRKPRPPLWRHLSRTLCLLPALVGGGGGGGRALLEANTIVGDSIFATEEERKETGEWSWGRGEAPLPADQRRAGRDALVPRASSSFRLFFFLQGEKATGEGWRWRRKRWRRWGMLPQSISSSSSSSSSWLSFFCGGGERDTPNERHRAEWRRRLLLSPLPLAST